MGATRPRQFRVVQLGTDIVILVNGYERWSEAHRHWEPAKRNASTQAGLRFPADCRVHRVPIGQETPLPFDEIPLVLRTRA